MADTDTRKSLVSSPVGRAVFLVVAFLVMLLMHAFVYLVAIRVYETTVPFSVLILALLSSFFLIASALVRKYDGRWVDVLYFIAASWVGIIFLAFSFTILYEVIGLFIPGDSHVLYNFLAGATVLFSFYALINGRRIAVKEIEIPIAKLEREVSIVHLSDVHIGTVHQKTFLERVVRISNNLKPDLVLMTGDLFDGSEPIHEEMLMPLDKLSAPAYFSTGNHEEYEGLQNVRSTIKNLKMQLLDSEVVNSHGLQIIGVNDRQSIPREVSLGDILTKLKYDRGKPTLLMYHTPVEWDAARGDGIDLMLSGHTHNGQIYPFNLLVRLFFKYVNGLYIKEGKYLYVSPGTGTWGPPMRLGTHNKITLLRLTSSTK